MPDWEFAMPENEKELDLVVKEQITKGKENVGGAVACELDKHDGEVSCEATQPEILHSCGSDHLVQPRQ
jgi:hypothetical protein